MLEEDRVALDRVAVKLEKELREAMNTAGMSPCLLSKKSRSSISFSSFFLQIVRTKSKDYSKNGSCLLTNEMRLSEDKLN